MGLSPAYLSVANKLTGLWLLPSVNKLDANDCLIFLYEKFRLYQLEQFSGLAIIEKPGISRLVYYFDFFSGLVMTAEFLNQPIHQGLTGIRNHDI
jgi:hypothetical protein